MSIFQAFEEDLGLSLLQFSSRHASAILVINAKTYLKFKAVVTYALHHNSKTANIKLLYRERERMIYCDSERKTSN